MLKVREEGGSGDRETDYGEGLCQKIPKNSEAIEASVNEMRY